ncbi:MAG TPA: DUF262 domain-containing HNH endonuclease family protein [Lacunisphaera sp.]|nr:DUF262 domain-containing HNH endonuclease family protein [Lacunisphaera sp.]
MAKIHGKEQRIGEVFSAAYAFSIPSYQRAYSWGVQQASELFDDLLAGSRESGKTPGDPYFLGSVVLIKEEAKPEADVIDGQQRLTTLSLLIAVLLKALPQKITEGMKSLLYEEGNPIMGTLDRYRLQLRDRENPFYEQYVLRGESFDPLATLDPAQLTDPRKRIRENLLLFRERVDALSPVERQAFATYLIRETFLIIVYTPSLESAFRIFSVLNDRGLDLSVADILKAEIIGAIPENARGSYTKKWEDAEELLGTEQFSDLFSHIRFIHACKKQKTTVLTEFREFVKAKDHPKAFIDEELTPYADALEQIRHQGYASTTHAEGVNRALRRLARLEERDWTGPALLFHSRHSTDSAKLVSFYDDLERLACIMWVLGYDVNNRLERYGRLIEAIRTGADLSAKDSPLQLNLEERVDAESALDGEIYTIGRKRTMILLRLDEVLSSGEARYDFPLITIEHVLPQTPPAASQWMKWWPVEEDRKRDVHRLGNLALLNRRQNASAKNYEFEKKKRSYFTTKAGGSPFMLTTQVLHEEEWTPEIFESRQKMLLQKLKEAWRL